MSTSRIGMRFSQSFRNTFRNAYGPFRHPGMQGRRFQSSEAGNAESQSYFQRMWDSPIGIKTVHFWAPVMKWAIVLSGVADFARPAEKLSLTQNAALMATGAIWTRWCMIITPRNPMLAAVNFFLGCVGVVQCSRIFLYHRAQEGSALQAAKDMEHEMAGSFDKAVHSAEHSAENAAGRS